MKTHKLPVLLSGKVQENNDKIQLFATTALQVKLTLAQEQIKLLQTLAQQEKHKAYNTGLVEGYGLSKKLDMSKIKLSDDGLSIIENG